jgi:hypothetical protein
MARSSIHGWREWFREGFIRQGVFSLKPLPTRPDGDDSASQSRRPPEGITRLNLDSEPEPPK